MVQGPSLTPPGFPDEGEVKLTVIVSARQLRELERRAGRDGISITEAVQGALEIGLIVWNAVRSRDRVLIQTPDGDLREIHLPRLGR